MRILWLASALALGAGACKRQGQGQEAGTMTPLPASAGMNPEDDSRAHKSPLANSPSAQPSPPLPSDGGLKDGGL
jgi:hypothetical protein